ncbi:MAG: recombinase family protein [Ruminiclostridium sp.]|nr:recombinase family protein [Ruminiclostridium sp.]
MENITNTITENVHKPIAYCLYRVSTVGQVDKVKDDIPMQRQVCHEFAERQGWIIGKEFLEKGVSGFKVSAAKRDAIQELKTAAERKEFDILLVFMFDRIGRIDEETPLVVKWFSDQGIRVWSTQEGEQRFESHVDKLMNYIRFWQASGESAKTSIRIKTRMQQLSAEGIYTGGPVPFGYCTVNNGRLNKKGREVLDLAIEPTEADWVRKLYEKTVTDGTGSYKLAMYLNDNGVRTHTGAKFQSESVIRILRNKMNIGYARNTDADVPHLPHLQIVDQHTFDRVQEILDQRSRSFDDKRTIARQTKSKNLLSGIMYCAHCGGRLTSIVYREKYTRKRDGSVYDRSQLKYLCYHKSRGLCKCDGQSTYVAERVDKAVCEVIHQMFESIKGAPSEEILQKRLKREMSSNKAKQTKINMELKRNTNQLEKLQDEIAATLTGDSVYSAEQLSSAIKTVEERISTQKFQLEQLQNEAKSKKTSIEKIRPMFDQFVSWAQEFDNSTIEQKKMIIAQLVTRIELNRDYELNIELNMDYKDFCDDWDTLNTKSTVVA